jgi:hypothetical protein
MTEAQQNVIEIDGTLYTVLERRDHGPFDQLVLSPMGKLQGDPNAGNSPRKTVTVMAEKDYDEPIKADENRLPEPIVKGAPIAMAPDYSPPEGEATMKVYCLESDAGSRYWYVNASKTKQYREEYGMEQATFITFDVPKTKAGLIHFLNEVCG